MLRNLNLGNFKWFIKCIYGALSALILVHGFFYSLNSLFDSSCYVLTSIWFSFDNEQNTFVVIHTY